VNPGFFALAIALPLATLPAGCSNDQPPPEEIAISPAAGESSLGQRIELPTTPIEQDTQKTEVAGRDEKSLGGEITVILRSLKTAGNTATLAFALRWDNYEAEPDAAVKLHNLGLKVLPTLTDSINLKQYYPLCAKGLRFRTSSAASILDVNTCEESSLQSPRSKGYPPPELANHRTVEGWAIFAAPDDTAVMEVAIGENLPTFGNVKPEKK
jgi:hypothetical protein